MLVLNWTFRGTRTLTDAPVGLVLSANTVRNCGIFPCGSAKVLAALPVYSSRIVPAANWVAKVLESKSPLLVVRQVVKGMVARGFGRIIQIGSEVVELGNPRFAAYVAAKAARRGCTAGAA